MIIHTDGKVETPFEKEKTITLEEMQKAVKGYAECIPLRDDLLCTGRHPVMMVNEEGIARDLTYNPYATLIADDFSGSYVVGICGDVMLGTVDGKGEVVPLTTGEEKFVLALLSGYNEMYGMTRGAE